MINPNSLYDIAQLLKASVDVEKSDSIVIGYSGGLDSSLLLHAAVIAFPGKELIAFHCDHGISGNSPVWAEHCKEQARLLKVNFVERKLSLGKNASEEMARESRYSSFSEYMQQRTASVLLLGHHSDDQVETLLFRLFRGSGLKGLSAIPETRSIGQGKLFRPFLHISKSILMNIAQLENINWVEDESNTSNDYDRNFVRNKLLPLICQRWPRASEQLLHARDVFNEADVLLGEYAESLVRSLEPKSEAFGKSFAITKLKKLSLAQYRLVLRYLVFISSGTQLNNSDLAEIKSQFFDSKDDASPKFKVGDIELRRYKNRLYLLENLPEEIDQAESIEWDGKQPFEVLGVGTLSLLEGDSSKPFEVRFRQGSERAKPLRREHSQTLKKLMQESDIEPWLRSRLPLVFLNDRLLNIGGVIRCSDHKFSWQWNADD